MEACKRKEYREILLSLVPKSGESIGNVSLREELQTKIRDFGDDPTDEDYWFLRDSLIDEGLLEQGRGRGGSVHRVLSTAPSSVAGVGGGSRLSGVTVGGVPVARAPEVVVEVERAVAEKEETSLYEP